MSLCNVSRWHNRTFSFGISVLLPHFRHGPMWSCLSWAFPLYPSLFLSLSLPPFLCLCLCLSHTHTHTHTFFMQIKLQSHCSKIVWGLGWGHGLQCHWVYILAILISSHRTLEKVLNFKPQFLHPLNEGENIFTGGVWIRCNGPGKPLTNFRPSIKVTIVLTLLAPNGLLRCLLPSGCSINDTVIESRVNEDSLG